MSLTVLRSLSSTTELTGTSRRAYLEEGIDMAKETQAERNARIEAELRRAGKEFTSAAEVRRQAAAQEARGNGRGRSAQAVEAPTRRRATEYFSGKQFDETTRQALKAAGVD